MGTFWTAFALCGFACSAFGGDIPKWSSVSSSSSFEIPSFLDSDDFTSALVGKDLRQCFADLSVFSEIDSVSDGDALPYGCKEVKNLCRACASCKKFTDGTSALSATEKNCVCAASNSLATLTGSNLGDCFISLHGGVTDFDGGKGDDCILIAAGGGTVNGGDGNDDIFLLSDGITPNIYVPEIDGGSGNDCIFLGGDVGAGGDFVVHGNGGDDVIFAPRHRENNVPAVGADAGILVTESSPGIWSTVIFSDGVNPASGKVSFVEGPPTPPLGTGSVQLETGQFGDGAARIQTNNFVGTPLSSITELQYSSYTQQAEPNSGLHIYLSLRLDLDNDGTEDDQIFFEPEYQLGYTMAVPDQADAVQGQWQTWNALIGGWWSNNDYGSVGASPGSNVKPLSAFLAIFPDAKIAGTDALPGLRLTAGFGAPTWNNFVGNLDAFRISFGGQSLVYNFEAAAGPGAGMELLYGDEGSDIILLYGNNLGYAAQISGGEGSDVIRVRAKVGKINDNMAENSGDDIVISGAKGFVDNLYGNVQGDKIIVKNFAYVNYLNAGDGVNTIALLNGAVAGSIVAGDDNDHVLVDGGHVLGNIRLLGGEDTLILGGHSGADVSNVFGGSGDDKILLNSDVLAAVVEGNAGADNIIVKSGARVGDVYGGDGSDTVWVNGRVLHNVYGDAGEDEIRIGSKGSVLENVEGNDDADIIQVDGRVGNVYGDAGADDIRVHSEGFVRGNVRGGDSADELIVSGAVGGAVYGGDGADNIQISSSAVVSFIDGGAGDDIIGVSSSADVAVVIP